MRTFYALWLSIAVLFITVESRAKDNNDLLKANYYYRHLAFYEAIPYFEKIAGLHSDPIIYSQLGDCYRFTNDFQKAAEAYEKAIGLKGCKDAVVLKYGQLLMQLMRYDEASKWLKQYQLKNKADNRVTKLIAGCESAKKHCLEMPSGTVHLLNFNTSGSEFAPTIWNGKLVFASDTAIDVKKKKDSWTGNSYINLYSVEWNGNGNCGNELSKVGGARSLNIKYHDGPCTFSVDGKHMFFTRSRYNDKFMARKAISNKDSIVLLEIMVADYDEKRQKFGRPISFQYNNEKYSVAHPAINPNGKVLVFSSNMPKGTGGCDLYMCKKTNKDKWSKPEHIGMVINTEGDEVFPYWADSATLYFSSDGHEGFGGLDIYKTTWNEQGKSFSAPENVGIPINSSYDDMSLALYADGRSSYFSSNRPAEKSGDNIYFYKREITFLNLHVIDSATRRPLSEVKLSLNTEKSKLDTFTNNNGDYFTRLYPGIKYSVTVSKDSFDSRTIYLSGPLPKEIDTIIKQIVLSRSPLPVEPVDIAQPPILFTKLVGAPELNKVYEIGHFYFSYGKSDLNDSATACLDSLVDYLQKNPTVRIQVRAHTDCRGNAAYNIKLSNMRAEAVVRYLVGKGVASRRLEHKGLGSSMPIVKCPDCLQCSEEDHYKNRILEFKVLEL